MKKEEADNKGYKLAIIKNRQLKIESKGISENYIPVGLRK